MSNETTQVSSTSMRTAAEASDTTLSPVQRPAKPERSGREEHGLRSVLQPSLIVSIVALTLSIASFAIGEYRSGKEAELANRRDVRGIIQRLTKLPAENFEIMQRAKSDPSIQGLTALLNQENVLLASQAAELIDRYPDSFTSTEYFAVAAALASSNLFSRVPAMFERAIQSATNYNDYTAATRSYGAYLYSQGSYSEGRAKYEAAADVWETFPEKNAATVNFYDFLTYLYWSQTAISAGQTGEAREHLVKAEQFWSRLPPGPATDQFRAQLELTRTFLPK